MSHSPPSFIIVDSEIELNLIEKSHAEGLMKLTDENRYYLRQWLPWVSHMQKVEDFRNYIQRCKLQHQAGSDYGYVIFYQGQMAGRIGIHQIDQANKTAALGYWLAQAFSGNGLISRSCETLIKIAFTEMGLNRIEIRCGTRNVKSAAVAERLGFRREAVLQEAECLNGKFIDLALYAMIKREWQKRLS